MTFDIGGRFERVFEDAAAQQLVLERAASRRPDGSGYQHYRMLIGCHGGVVVIASDGAGIVLGRSWRPAVGQEMLELPRGLTEASDLSRTEEGSAVVAGLRELAEETGLTARNARVIGSFVVDSAVYPLVVRVVACRVSSRVMQTPDGELSAVERVSPDDVDRLIADGLITDAVTLAAFAIWRSTDAGSAEPR